VDLVEFDCRDCKKSLMEVRSSSYVAAVERSDGLHSDAADRKDPSKASA